jgi:hypothetical protein
VVDCFCSILFPLAFTLVMLCVYSTAMIAIVAGLAFAVSRLLLNGEHFTFVSLGIFLVAFLVPLAAWGLDKAVGGRVRPGDPGERAIRGLSTAAYYVNAMPAYGTVLMTLFTNAKKGTRYPMMYALMAVLFGFVMVKDVFLGKGVVLAADHLYLPDDPGRFGVGAEYYESQRDPGAVYDRTPSIQADMVRDPYIKLFIPYTPVRHGEAFVDRCPQAPRLSRGGVRMNVDPPPQPAQVRAVLECWTRLQPVTLNGQPLRAEFRFYTHPQSGLRGIMAYIPTAGLPRGENLLTVGVSPRDSQDQRMSERVRGGAPEPHYIPFWL